jgi:hypothetical protein
VREGRASFLALSGANSTAKDCYILLSSAEPNGSMSGIYTYIPPSREDLVLLAPWNKGLPLATKHAAV